MNTIQRVALSVNVNKVALLRNSRYLGMCPSCTRSCKPGPNASSTLRATLFTT